MEQPIVNISPYGSDGCSVQSACADNRTKEMTKIAMKKMWLTFAMALVFAMSLQAFAQYDEQGQEQEQQPQGQEQGGHGHRMGNRGSFGNPDQELARLTKQLNLTSDQQNKIKPMLENQAQQMQQLRQDTSLTQQDRFSKMRAIRDNTMTQVREVLNSDQQQKLDSMMKNREGGHRHSGSGQNPPQPQ